MLKSNHADTVIITLSLYHTCRRLNVYTAHQTMNNTVCKDASIQQAVSQVREAVLELPCCLQLYRRRGIAAF